MSEASQTSTENTGTEAPPKRAKKKRPVWNDKRRLTLLMILLDEPATTEELFSKFREKEKYRALTYDRVVREAKALCNEAVSGDEELYVLKMPPAPPKVKPKKLTIADRRRALIAAHAKKMNARQRQKHVKDNEKVERRNEETTMDKIAFKAKVAGGKAKERRKA